MATKKSKAKRRQLFYLNPSLRKLFPHSLFYRDQRLLNPSLVYKS